MVLVLNFGVGSFGFLAILFVGSFSADIQPPDEGRPNEEGPNQFAPEEGAEALYSGKQSTDRHFTDTIPGDPGSDYPAHRSIPKTAFSCKGKTNWGYYADIETDCQVFHICENNYSKVSFLCPTGSIFNQKYLVCDWWYNTECNANSLAFEEEIVHAEVDLNQIAAPSGDPIFNVP